MKWSKFFIKFERYFLYLNFFFAALLLLSYLSGVISPQKFWPLAFLGLGYLMLLYVNLFFVIYWSIRGRKYFFISAISILTGFNVLLNNVGFNFFHSASSGTHLKLMTYNVHVFETADNIPAYKEIPQLINLNQPDILGIEEFYTAPSRFNGCGTLAKVLHTDQYYFEPFKITQYDSVGLALFSKYPIIQRGIIRLSNDQNDNQGIYIDIKYQSHLVRVYCFHLKSLQFDPLDYNNLDRLSHKGKISLHNLKEILRKLKAAYIVRGQQVDLIRRHASKCLYPYIFLGDFNDTPGSYAFNQMSIGMKNAFREKGFGIGKTFNGSVGNLQIDYILASKQFHFFNYNIIHKAISDHYPVCSEVGFN